LSKLITIKRKNEKLVHTKSRPQTHRPWPCDSDVVLRQRRNIKIDFL
jgi:hypothetical protein